MLVYHLYNTTKKKSTALAVMDADVAQGIEDTKPETSPASLDFAGRQDARRKLIKLLGLDIVRKAWFTASHLVLPQESKLADIGCGQGQLTYAMAVMNPHLSFIGVDSDAHAVAYARRHYRKPNLKYVQADVTRTPMEEVFEDTQIDAFINSFMLCEIYSQTGYQDSVIGSVLEKQMGYLREGGLIYIRDYAAPSGDEFVLLELLSEPSQGDDIATMTDADLLQWYAQNARPWQGPGRGFFLEELPSRLPGTRLFRLPNSWAFEFMIRRDSREHLESELPKDHTAFSVADYHKEIATLGGRARYTGLHWNNPLFVKKEKPMRLYKEDGSAMSRLPASFSMVIQNTGQGQSLSVSERRTVASLTDKDKTNLTISAVKNEKTGQITDLVSRHEAATEVIPYRISGDKRLMVYVNPDVHRGIINTVPRSSFNLDGKSWSGHMIETYNLDTYALRDAREESEGTYIRLLQNQTGFSLSKQQALHEGPGFYPSPDYIDERVETLYMPIDPLSADDKTLFCIDAQTLLNAISVGVIPNARLEVQLLGLYNHLKLPFESWAESPLTPTPQEIESQTTLKDISIKLTEEDKRFKSIRGTVGHLKPVHSTFVAEGQVEGTRTGLQAWDMDFVLRQDETVNRAVVLPLTKDLSGEVMAAVVQEYFPVPQRYKGTGFLPSAPSFILPKHVRSMDDARHYIAEQFEVEDYRVAPMGESFFTHTGVTPERVYPFAVTNLKGFYDGQAHGTTAYTPLKDLWKMLYLDNYDSFMKIVAMSYQQFGQDSELSVRWDFDASHEAGRTEPKATQSTPTATPSAMSAPKPVETKPDSAQPADDYSTLTSYPYPKRNVA